MKDRRSLKEGLDIDPVLAKNFVYGEKANTTKQPQSTPAPLADSPLKRSQPPLNRVPLNARVRSDFAEALKTESLQRQLRKQYPNSMQELLEEILEPWLRENGYLS